MFLTYPRQNISRLWLQRVKAKAEMMGWELKQQISGQHCRAVSVPEHSAGFVKDIKEGNPIVLALGKRSG